MIQVVLLTHGELGQALLSVAQMILDKKLDVQVIGFGYKQRSDGPAVQVKQLIDQLAPQDGLIALTDSFGGTPSNLILPYLEPGRIEIITGVNLGLLLYLGGANLSADIKDICMAAKQAGKESILVAGEFL